MSMKEQNDARKEVSTVTVISLVQYWFIDSWCLLCWICSYEFV